MEGQPLSVYWENGDTFFTVALKKTKNFYETIFDPRTYSYEGIQKARYYNS